MILIKNEIKKFYLLFCFSTMIFTSNSKFKDYNSTLFESKNQLNIEKKFLNENIKKLMDKNTYYKNRQQIDVLVHVSSALIQIYHVADDPALLASSTLNLVDYICNLTSRYKDFLTDIVEICFYPFFAQDGAFDLFTGVPWDHPLRIIPSLKKIACKLKELGLSEKDAEQIYLKLYYNLPNNITQSAITDDLCPLEMNNHNV